MKTISCFCVKFYTSGNCFYLFFNLILIKSQSSQQPQSCIIYTSKETWAELLQKSMFAKGVYSILQSTLLSLHILVGTHAHGLWPLINIKDKEFKLFGIFFWKNGIWPLFDPVFVVTYIKRNLMGLWTLFFCTNFDSQKWFSAIKCTKVKLDSQNFVFLLIWTYLTSKKSWG